MTYVSYAVISLAVALPSFGLALYGAYRLGRMYGYRTGYNAAFDICFPRPESER